MSEFEKLLTAVLNGESADITPKSRMEKYLKNCVDKCGCADLPTPRTRGEVLLYQLAEKMAGESGTDSPLPIEVSTEAEMTALLESGEIGGVYKYTGTTGTYENGALYVLEEA